MRILKFGTPFQIHGPGPPFRPLCTFLLMAITLMSTVASPLIASDKLITIGVLAKRGTERCLEQWSPTADYLSQSLPGLHFEIVPIAFDHINPVVEKGAVDFILANSSFYVELEIKYGVNRIATLKNKRLDGAYTTFGGVIFSSKDRTDIRTLEDLKGKRFMAVDEQSFGGWRMAWRELKEAGVDPFSDFDSMEFGGTHDSVVYAVRDRVVDAGTVRTDTLERMEQEGLISMEDFYIIHERKKPKTGMLFRRSTRIYPEWPMAKVRHTEDALAEAVAIKLIEMPADSPAAIASSASGWTIPLNYQGVHDCLKSLKVGPYEDLGKITIGDVLRKFWQVIGLAVLLIVVMAFSILVFFRLNRNIRAYSDELQHEVEEHKETARLLRAATREAESANLAKGNFLANMSHEIRTPMNAIIGMSHLCLGTTLNPKQQDYLQKIHQSSQMLLGIINDILDFSKIEAGKLVLEKVPFELNEVLDSLSNMVSMSAHRKGLEFLFDVDPQTPQHLIGDPLRFGQILLNLAGNSVKFTDEGEVVVRIRPLKSTRESVTIEVLVRDTGIGMSSDQMDKLFQSFSQADSSTTRRFGGSGLGLAICKHLVQEMNGNIFVESDLGKGSLFRFTVTFGIAAPREDKLASRLPLDLEQLKVLVVDDMESARDMFAATLESFSFRATCVESGPKALEILENAPAEDPYRLVLMDYRMPEMNGLQASRLIKESSEIEDIPTLIMVTAYRKDDIAQEAQDIGLDGFLPKPVTPSTLLDTIINAIGKGGGLGKEGRSGIANHVQPVSGIRGAHVLLAEDNTINQQVACELLMQAGLRVSLADHGEQAVGMVEKTSFDAVLMDINMPVMDGYQATQAIREITEHKDLPIIAMTANAMAGDRERCLEAGMNDHVPKPIEPTLLFETLRKWIPERHAPLPSPDSDPKDTPKSKPVLPSHIPGIDMETGLRRSGGNAKLYGKLLEEFVVDHGNDQFRLLDAIAQGNLDQAHRIAHTLKGVAGGIGASELFETAVKLDEALRGRQAREINLLTEQLSQKLRVVREALEEAFFKESHLEAPLVYDCVVEDPEITSLMDAIQNLAEEMDPGVEEKAEELSRLLYCRGGAYKDLGARLARQAANLDFDMALDTLQELRTSLEPLNTSPG